MNCPSPCRPCVLSFKSFPGLLHICGCPVRAAATERMQQGPTCGHWLTPVRCWSFWCKLFTCVLRQHSQTFGGNFALFVIQVFKRHNPSTAEEQEMMENLFDSLCSCLMLSSNRDRFLKGEGLQLMNLMLRYLISIVISFLLGMCQRMFWPDIWGSMLKFLC